MATTGLTPREQIEQAIQSLLKQGRIRDSGQRRNGQIVWAINKH
jgi:hypothetical protein